MSVVYLSLGSNVDQQKNICSALRSLKKAYPSLEFSSVYESESVGFSGANFYNLVARFETDNSLSDVHKHMRAIEDEHGRVRGEEKFSDRSLDIDILTYDQLVGDFDGLVLPRDEITKNAFVLLPLAELAGQVLHPALRVSYSQLWQQFEQEKQKLWTIDVGLSGQGGKEQSNIAHFFPHSPYIAASGQPTEKQLEDIALLGFEAIINLCGADASDSKEDAVATSLGMSYIHIPVPWQNPLLDHFQLFVSILTALENKKTWVHCQLNKRASVFLYLYRKHILSEDPGQALADLKALWQPDEVWMAFIKRVDAAFENKVCYY